MTKGKLILYWDYELQRGCDTSMLREPFDGGQDDYEQTEFILHFLDKFEIKCCFAALGLVAEKGSLPYHARNQVRKISDMGHEIGAHTYNHKPISRMSYSQFKKDIMRTKEILESVTGKPCVSFVPPWDNPHYFLSLNLPGIDVYPSYRKFVLSRMTYANICKALREAGYKTYRVCSLTPFKNQLSQPFYYHGIRCIPSIIGNGFIEKHKKLVDKAVKTGGLAVVYGHPLGLAGDGPQNKKYFVDFVKYVYSLIRVGRLDVVLPRDLIKNDKTQNL